MTIILDYFRPYIPEPMTPESIILSTVLSFSSSKVQNFIERLFNLSLLHPTYEPFYQENTRLSAAETRIGIGLGQMGIGALQGLTEIGSDILFGSTKIQTKRSAAAQNLLHGYLNTVRGVVDFITNIASIQALNDFNYSSKTTSALVLGALPIARIAYEIFGRKQEMFFPYIKNDSTKTIDQQLSETETLFRRISFIPLAGSFAGASRLVMGLGQEVPGITLFAIGILGTACSKKQCFQRFTVEGKKQISRGMNNIFGGAFAIVPLVGPLLEKRFCYTYEPQTTAPG